MVRSREGKGRLSVPAINSVPASVPFVIPLNLLSTYQMTGAVLGDGTKSKEIAPRNHMILIYNTVAVS